MTLEQRQTVEATESQAHYSPEEAGEILRIAAHLQDNTITAEQLRAIAREAGVSDENLERAIQQYEQSRQAEAHKQQQRANRKRRLVIWGSLSALTLFFLLLGSMSFTVRVEPSAISHNTTAHQPVNPIPSKATVLVSSSATTVYKVEGRIGETIIIGSVDGHYHVVGTHFRKVSFASISPTGEHVMLYDSETGEVWTVSTDGQALQRVARAGELLQYGNDYMVVDENNPFAGWYTDGDTDVLMIRLQGGRTASIRLSAE